MLLLKNKNKITTQNHTQHFSFTAEQSLHILNIIKHQISVMTLSVPMHVIKGQTTLFVL